MPEFLKADNLQYSYPSDEGEQPIRVLLGINLEIKKGSFVAVLGHNGSGKSTLVKHFNAILLPTGGRMYVLGMDTFDEDKTIEIRRSVGMVFQNPDNQLVSNVVEEDVAFGPENLGVPTEELRKRVDEALSMVEMSEMREHAPHLLSGGQKQRIAIAGVIAMRPACIVLDEPTAMLDPFGRSEVLKTIHQLNKNNGITVVLITHHMSEAVDADRVVVLDSGRIAMDAAPREVFSRGDELRALGLTVPDGAALIEELKKAGLPVSNGALTPDECAREIYSLFNKASEEA